ncbi:MAG: hypothetical protein C4B59_10210 [Candidatus Methanogaster sp.]|uniref:Uncharacterized protein n=1 Tax=Candidatus Methanogaster sp. TaxID=3386292 RepID=A0AC61L1H1_9EURY|nr:MAG: hypothetical protein C4B59_10210 [ANME-2 cluster archaeon]
MRSGRGFENVFNAISIKFTASVDGRAVTIECAENANDQIGLTTLAPFAPSAVITHSEFQTVSSAANRHNLLKMYEF